MDQEMSLPKTSKKSASKSKSKRKTNRPSEPETTPDINPERKLEIKPEIKPDPSCSKLDDLGFLEISPGIEPVVDIIAIHGLQGHREKTWTTEDGVCWLRGLLPSDLPNVRILSYGYDADTDSHECVSTQTIGRQAEGLANALVRIREGAPRRPMIFIAHNIGGIILKRALIISHNQNPGSKGHLRDILVSTHGVLFFGTPHFGAENTTFLEGINLVLSLYMETTDAVLKDLRSHSTELENIQKDWVAASENISSIFFCEDYVMSNQGEVNVPHHSASIAGDRNATMVILHADHRNLVRFPSRENDNYKAVHYHLKEYVNTAPEAIFDKWVQEDDLRNVVLGEPTPKRAIQLSELMVHLPSVTFVPSSVHNTCLKGTRKAVLEAIQDWANNGDSSKPIFWLCDIAGSGKSTVAMTAMESWRKQGVLGGQFFFSIASSDASTTDRLCSSIARDLAQFLPKLTPYLSQAVTGNPSIMQSSFDDQFQILVTGPVELWKGHVVLVIDAVDECKSTSQRKKLLDTLSTAVQKCKNLRVFMTSRPDPVIESVLGSLSVKAKLEDRLHNVNHPNNISDIALYVHQSLNQTLSEEKRQRLVGKANGLFIWASTACRMINDETTMETPEEIYDRLVSLEEPGAIDEVYDLVFERTGKESYAIQCQMLALLLVAFEPLTVGDMEDLVKHVGVRGSVKRLIRNLGSVLSVEPGTNLVQFRHPTLFEYLGRCSIAPVVGDSKKIYLDAVNAHGQVASWCIRCLKSRTDGLKFNICRIESSFRLNRQIPDLEARVSRFITRRLRYASSHWLFHMSGTDGKRRCMLEKEFGAVVQSPRVLHWMEALSLTRGVPRAIAGLRALAGHIELKGETRRRISDIRRCLIAFSVPIQESAPHVYISVLPFTPKESILRIEGVREYGGTLNVIRGLEHAYPGPPMALQGHEESVSGVAFSPDGSRIASCSEDHTIRLWDVDTGEPMGNPFRGHSGSVWAVAFSPDGSRVASGSADKTIRLWDANTGEQLGEPLRGHSDSVWAVSFSPDGSRVVSGSAGNTIRLWDANTGEQVGEPLRGHSESVLAVAFSPDGSRVVSGSYDETIRIWDANTGEQVGEPLRGHSDGVFAVAFSPDGSRVVSGSGDETIRLWNANTGKQIGEPLRGHSNSVLAIAFSPDGSRVVSGSGDNTIQVWDANTGEQVGEPLQGHNQAVNAVAFSPDGSRVVSGSRDKTIRLWDANTGEQLGEPLRGHSESVFAVAFSPDGSRVVSGSADKTIRLWDASTGEQVGEPLQGHTESVFAVAFSPDGSRVVSGSGDETIRLWDANTGEQVGESLRGHSDSVNAVAFSPDGSRVVSGSYDSTIRIWDANTGEQVGETLRGHSQAVFAVAFSPDGSRVVSGSTDTTIRIWDVNTDEQVGEPLRGHSSWVKAVAFSPDGVRVVSGSWDRTIRLWDANTGEQVGEPLRDHSSWVNTVAFSPDGSRVVSGSNDKTIRVWDANTGEQVGEPLQGHSDWVSAAAFSPDGSRIVSGSGDKTIRLWGANTGEQVGEPLRGYSDSVNAVAFSSDGSHIASGFANTVQILDNTPGSSSKQLIQRYEHPVLVTSTPDGPRIVSCSTGDINVMLHADSDPDINQEGGESTSSYLAEEPQDVLVIPGFNQCLLTYDGWVQSTGRFLFWVPPNNRYGLQNPRLILTMPTSSSFRATKLDFTNFQCGPSWTNVQASTN